MSEPTTVNRPATIQASSSPGIDGSAPLISEGWTKMEAPMIVPTTIAVVCERRSVWRSSGRPGVCGVGMEAGSYHDERGAGRMLLLSIRQNRAEDGGPP